MGDTHGRHNLCESSDPDNVMVILLRFPRENMSNNSGEQNGRQNTPHQQSTAPKDPRTKKGPSSGTATTSVDPKTTICRDYIWGICTKGAGCKYKHELEYSSMRATLKFCHNFQNRGTCGWPDCTYLHISRDEENLFVTTGQIPRILAERYAAMSVYEYMAVPPPPPPPPPPAPASNDVRFDPSRPPPPLPTKKRSSDTTEAGTSAKLRKVESPDILCDNCIQRDLRFKITKQEQEKMRQEEEKTRLNLKKKTDDYQKGKLLLKSILSPKWYCIMDNYVESDNQGNNAFSLPSFVSETSTVPRQFLLQLVEHVLSSANSRNIFESVQSTSRESSLMESLSGLNRRNSATSPDTPDTLHALLEALRPSSDESEQRAPNEQRTSSDRSGATSNGLTRLGTSGVPAVPGPMSAPVPYVPSSAPPAGSMPPPARPYYGQPYGGATLPAPPSAASQPQPYYTQQYAGVRGPAAQYAAPAPPYPTGSSVAHQYPPTGADSGILQPMNNGRNTYQYSSSYTSYYSTAPSYQ